VNPLERLGLVDASPAPKLNVSALKRQGPRDYMMRFAFGAVIAAVAGIAGLGMGDKMGGVLLAFPAILPASLTLIERKEGRRIAAIDAMGAILGSIALIGFAITASLGLRHWGGVGLAAAALVWMVLASALYVLIVWLPRRRKRPLARARPTST